MKLIWTALFFVLLAGTAEATTRYASNTGAGAAPCTTSSPAASRCNVITGLAQLVAGDTLQLLGNTMTNPAIYQGANYMIVPPVGLSGNNSNRITVQCTDISGTANPGACLIDGQFVNSITGTPRITMNLSGNDWWIFEDFNMRQSARSVVNLLDSNNNIFRRMVVWDSPIDRNGTVVNINTSSDNLFEDFAAFGTGRKIFSPFSTTTQRTTFRRCWARWEGSINTGPKFTITTSYHSDDTTVENCIMTFSGSQMPQNYTVTDNSTVWDSDSVTAGVQPQTWNNFDLASSRSIANRDATETDGCRNSVNIYGSIFYLKSTDRFVNSGSAATETLVALGGKSAGADNQDCSTIQHSLALVHPSQSKYSQTRAFAFDNGATQSTYSHLTSISSPADSIGANWLNLDGPTAHAAWGANTPPTLPAGISSPWTNTGDGATICTRWGTTTPLWPWPMNERIKIATGMAGNYFTNNGPGCGPSQGACSGTLGSTRTETDVTREIEDLLGTIPAECRTSSEEPFPAFTGFPAFGQLTSCSAGSSSPPVGFVTLSGSAWTETGGDCFPASAFGTTKWNSALEPDQEAWAELSALPATGSTFLLNFRIVDNNNRYRVYASNVSGTNNDTLTIDKIESGVTTVLNTINLARDIAVNDRIGVKVLANAIQAGYYTNWSGTTEWRMVGTATATTAPATSYIGMGANTPSKVTQFGGGSATPADVTAPTAPSNLTVTPQAAVAMDLAWTASTDAVGVTEYHVFRGAVSDCSDCVQIGTNTTNAYTDNNATPGTTFYYRVTALDAALNESSASSIVPGRVPDGVAFDGGSGKVR